MRYLIACPNILAPTVTRLFLDYIQKLHGLPKTIISNRGRQFVSIFQKELTTRLRVKVLLSTAHYPQTDSQIERVNTIIEQYIRIYTLYLQDDQINQLIFAEFTVNVTGHSRDTLHTPTIFHHDLPQSAAICRSPPQYVCNMSVISTICLQYIYNISTISTISAIFVVSTKPTKLYQFLL